MYCDILLSATIQWDSSCLANLLTNTVISWKSTHGLELGNFIWKQRTFLLLVQVIRCLSQCNLQTSVREVGQFFHDCRFIWSLSYRLKLEFSLTKLLRKKHSSASHLLPVPRHNLSFGSRAFRISAKKYGIPYLLTFCSLKRSLHLDVI